MARIQANFDDVPDQILPVKPGVYTLLINDAKTERTKDDKGDKLVLEMKVNDEGSPEFGRMVFDHIGLKGQGLTTVKRVAKSAGIAIGSDGLDTSDLVGKVIQARIKNRTYTDPQSGEVKETSSIAEYMFA